MCKKTKSGKCEQCEREEELLISFGSEKYRCSYCMTVEGLCQECGDYIPMPDPDDENDPLWKLDNSPDFAPSVCLECFAE